MQAGSLLIAAVLIGIVAVVWWLLRSYFKVSYRASQSPLNPRINAVKEETTEVTKVEKASGARSSPLPVSESVGGIAEEIYTNKKETHPNLRHEPFDGINENPEQRHAKKGQVIHEGKLAKAAEEGKVPDLASESVAHQPPTSGL